MTNQELYNQSVRDIINQGGPSANESTCLYRKNNGRKCVAGHRIPDDKYVPEMENQTLANEDDKIRPIFENVFGDLDIVCLSSLQFLHDSNASFNDDLAFFKDWVPEMITYGRENDLDISVFEEYLDNELVGEIVRSTLP